LHGELEKPLSRYLVIEKERCPKQWQVAEIMILYRKKGRETIE